MDGPDFWKMRDVTGKVIALEALMRVEMPLLRSPEDVLRLAKEERCLHELERITFFGLRKVTVFCGITAR